MYIVTERCFSAIFDAIGVSSGSMYILAEPKGEYQLYYFGLEAGRAEALIDQGLVFPTASDGEPASRPTPARRALKLVKPARGSR